MEIVNIMKIKSLLKKTLCCLIAIAMICSMAVTAFATDGLIGSGSSSDAIENLPVTVHYKMDNEGLQPDGRFILTLTPSDPSIVTTLDTYTINKGVALKANEDENLEGIEQKDGAVSAFVEFNSRGVRQTENTVWTLSETVNIPLEIAAETVSAGYYHYDLTVAQDTRSAVNSKMVMTTANTKYDVILLVNNKGTIVSAQIRNQSGTKANPVVTVSFSTSCNLIVENHIVTAADDPKDSFNYTIWIPEGGAGAGEEGVELTKGTALTAYIEDKDGGRTYIDTITVCENNPTDTEGATGSSFSLKSGERLVIPGLPEGMMYWVCESDANTSGFESSYLNYNDTPSSEDYTTYSDAAETKTEGEGKDATETTVAVIYNGQVGTNTDGGTTYNNFVDYYNVKEFVDTGIEMEFAPYIVMFTVAAAAFVLLLVSKKRKAVR
jgi:hypothetical protein